MILTDVKKVQRGYGTLMAQDIDRMTLAEAKDLLAAGEFGVGSMGPKILAATNFLEAGGERALVADLDEAPAALNGEAGTLIVPA